jgi:hypothetical protein
LKQDLLRLRNAWRDFQESRDRDAVYGYLSAVFNLMAWWTADGRALDRARRALRLQNLDASKCNEPFAGVILCTSDPAKVDRRTRSKWSRALRYAREIKSHSEPLDQFVKRKGGITVHVGLPNPLGWGDALERISRVPNDKFDSCKICFDSLLIETMNEILGSAGGLTEGRKSLLGELNE